MENRSSKAEDLYYIIIGCLKKMPDNIAYFHASYRQEHPVQKGRSYTIIDGIQGKGRFLGVTLATGMNGNNTCWAEGERDYASVAYWYQSLPSAVLKPLPDDSELCMR